MSGFSFAGHRKVDDVVGEAASRSWSLLLAGNAAAAAPLLPSSSAPFVSTTTRTDLPPLAAAVLQTNARDVRDESSEAKRPWWGGVAAAPTTSTSLALAAPRTAVGFDNTTCNKRMRYTITEPAQQPPPVQNSDIFLKQQQQQQQPEQEAATAVVAPVVWWKQPQTASAAAAATTDNNNNAPAVCHVCRNSLDATEEGLSCSAVAPTVSKNKTLFAYFAPTSGAPPTTTPSSSSSTVLVKVPLGISNHQTTRTTTTCTFCERRDICGCCWQTCDGCHLPFCSFCRTTDGNLRPVCLDCHCAAEQQNKNKNDDCAMQLE